MYINVTLSVTNNQSVLAFEAHFKIGYINYNFKSLFLAKGF